MGARTDAARAAAVASRGDLAEQLALLEGSARAAVDFPAKLKRAPAKTAGAAAGVAFLAVGGPRRVYRGIRRVVRGPEKELPASMLPDQIERSLKKLGTDGDRVRGTLERDFASYLESTAKARRSRDVRSTAGLIGLSIFGPMARRGGTRLAEVLFSPKTAGPESFGEALDRARARWTEAGGSAPDSMKPPATPKPPSTPPTPPQG
ncbi:MAG: hypothetical protein ACHQ3P_00840 [Candidatus Limnocylindrales bacterium]